MLKLREEEKFEYDTPCLNREKDLEQSGLSVVNGTQLNLL